MQKRKGFTLVELVIVIAVIAILAGVLIGTFASVINRANESARMQELKAQEIEQKAEDILKKIDDSNWYGWEDFEVSLAEKLTETYKKYASAGVTTEQIETAVKKAIEEYAKNNATDNTSLTEEQVKAIVENAIGKVSFNGVTEAQVRAIVGTAASNITANQLTVSQVKSIVNAAADKGLTAAQVAQVVGSLNLATTTNLSSAVTDITNAISTAAASQLTTEDLENAIIALLPVTKTAANATEFTELVGRLNSGSTIIIGWDASSDNIAIGTEAGDKTLTIKGSKIDTLTVNAPQATIYLLANAENVEIEAIAKNSFHVLGKVKSLTANSGRIVLEGGASVQTLTAAPATSQWVIVEIEEKAEVTNELVAEYQKHSSGTYDYIEIVNKGDINVSKLTMSTETQGSAVTTNVVITNVNGTKSGNAGDPSQDTLNVVSVINDTDVGLAVDGTNYIVVIQENNSVIKPGEGSVIPVENGVAKIGSVVFDNVYDALKVVPFDNNETLITLIGDCEIISNTGYTIKSQQNIVLDLNGHTLRSTAQAASTSALITVNGTLTVKDSTDTANNGTGTGKLITLAERPDGSAIPGYANNTVSVKSGKMTLESGTIVNKTTNAGATYCVDVDGSFDMMGGRLIGELCDQAVRVCVFSNNESTFNMYGGIIEVGGFWLQQAGDTSKKSFINIYGGEVNGFIDVTCLNAEEQIVNIVGDAVINASKIRVRSYSNSKLLENNANATQTTTIFFTVDCKSFVLGESGFDGSYNHYTDPEILSNLISISSTTETSENLNFLK